MSMSEPTIRRRAARRLTVMALALALVGLMLPAASAASPAGCANRNNNTYDKLLECVTAEGAGRHLEAFQAIADANGDTRASGTPGYDASAEYVAGLAEAAGYDVTVQEFDFPFFQQLSDPELEQISPDPTTYVAGEDFITMTYSAAGDVTATVEAVDLSLADPSASTSGCESADFAGFTLGNIALVQRGACTFAQKATNAEAAGAVGVIVFNNGAPGATDAFAGTLGAPVVTVPVVGASFAVGVDLADPAGTVARLATDTIAETRQTVNVFAETPGGRDDNVVMIGAHLDSVVVGPGINDNGSGSAGLLEVALAMSKLKPENKVRFAWWGAEELGLIGSRHYVASLTEEERNDIALYLNYDMIASPNYVRFIYDGDGSAFGLAGPEGSEQIEALYADFYASLGLASEPTQISFRSDYAAFFENGIPFGGLFTGAEGVKTAAQEAIYGGTAGIAYDPCYHQPCDTIDNIAWDVFDVNVDAIAFTALTYAYSTETVNGEAGRRVPGPPSAVFGSSEAGPEGTGDLSGGGLHEHHAEVR